MFKTRSLSLRPKPLDQQIDLFLRKVDVCFSLLSMQCPGDGRLPRTVSSVVSDTWGPETESLWLPEAGGQGVSPVWALSMGWLWQDHGGAVQGGRVLAWPAWQSFGGAVCVGSVDVCVCVLCVWGGCRKVIDF